MKTLTKKIKKVSFGLDKKVFLWYILTERRKRYEK